MTLKHASTAIIAASLALGLAGGIATAQEDAYESYVKTSKDFQRVKQDKAWALKAFPSWVYMPWSTGAWAIGFGDDAGKWCLDHGYNGAFLDKARTKIGRYDKLAWINKFKMPFYVDHIADKGSLYLRDRGKGRLQNTGLRKPAVNAAMEAKLKGIIRRYIGNVISSPHRAAYALDDEISWGSFVKPCMWRITDDEEAFPRWLAEIYGAGNAPDYEGWISYNSIWPKLSGWSVKDFRVSQLMDQWTFNDSYWNNFLGDLVTYANTIDPRTPCGFVGGQSPNAFGGYDYAKVMRKVQFIESYNIGGSQAVIRSLNPRNALPVVTTHFHKNVRDSIWQTWYYLAHGNRGFIGWADKKWFPGRKPAAFHDALAATYKEAGRRIGPLMTGAEWIHDGVAVYYNHASIQLNWILDAQAHGKTWLSRNDDHALGSSHNGRIAWENMLRDEGLQYTFIDYASVIKRGVPDEYKVLILPATLCLSEAEARRIKDFCRGGGTVIADYMPGLWDQHGRPHAGGGVLDEMFGVAHDPDMKASDVFQTKLWVEVDQDANYKTWRTSWADFFTKGNDSIKHASGFHKAVRKMDVAHVNDYGKGKAVLMNLSPQWYAAYRPMSFRDAARREVFMKHVRAGGPKRWVRVVGANAEKVHGYEISYWSKGGRTILYVCFNPEVRGTSLGGGNSVGLKSDVVPITLSFDRAVANARDERTGRALGSGEKFRFTWKMNEAVVISFDAQPPR